MKFLLVVLLSLALVPAKSKVIVITDDDFDHKTKEGVWMIDIFAPWCVAARCSVSGPCCCNTVGSYRHKRTYIQHAVLLLVIMD
jgi:hypothetical protein